MKIDEDFCSKCGSFITDDEKEYGGHYCGIWDLEDEDLDDIEWDNEELDEEDEDEQG